jgi:peptide/nickel transport system substrate-binding protein
MFESTVAGSELVLVANKDYHLGAPTFDKFIIHVMATTNASSAMLAGDIDFCYPFLSHDELELLESYDYITTVRRDIPSISSYIVINQLVYDDYRLNKAIDLAIDRDVIAAMLGDAEPIESFIMSNTKYYDDTCTYTYDPEAAKALVDEMAAEGTFNPNDPFYICCGSSSEDLANLIASYLQAVGINASISMMEGTTMIAGLHSTDVGCGLLSKDMAANPMWMKNLLTSKTSTTINTTSDVWDVFYERFMAASSEDEEIAIVKEMQQTWLEQEPYIFYAARYSDYCYNSRLGDNVNLQALENYNLAVWEWDVH